MFKTRRTRFFGIENVKQESEEGGYDLTENQKAEEQTEERNVPDY